MELKLSQRSLNLDDPCVMGILNVTSDSFFDGGRFVTIDTLQLQVEKMLHAGVNIIDVGGESTRPGAQGIGVEEELNRIIPCIELIRRISDVPISIDTSKPEVMCAGIAAGADLVNDVNALRTTGALQTLAELGVPVCLMHMQGQPKTMQQQPSYVDIVQEILDFFVERIEICVAAGIDRDKIVLDPGFGFGKTVRHNFQLLKKLELFHNLNCPLLVGMSRKSMLGAVTDKAVDQRLAGSLAAAVIAAIQGAQILRVHDVAETVDALKVVKVTKYGLYDG